MKTEAQKRANSAWTVEYNKRNRVRRNEWLRAWCKRNPEARWMRYLRHRLKSKYGMTPEDYERRLKDQCGRCVICACLMTIPSKDNRVRTGKSAVVDHDANTGLVRGILCNNCNRAIGLLEHNIDFLTAAIQYLKPRD